jgi:hypothetical protein
MRVGRKKGRKGKEFVDLLLSRRELKVVMPCLVIG